ncbi:MAG: hypothetical protein H6961_10415 [Chromatiaceae bacterium]|nr:hypothetical protein [Chromatiaceae bacterium]
MVNLEDDLEYQNWVKTTFGKYLAGIQNNDEPLPAKCPICGCPDYDSGKAVIANRRLNTSYVDDKKNWLISCESCFDEIYDQYAEMWSEYYAMVM